MASVSVAVPRPGCHVTQTIGVFTLGLVTFALSQFVPEQLSPWLNLAAALLVVAMTVRVLRAVH